MKQRLLTVGFMVLVTGVFTLLLTGANLLTRDRIRQNEIAKRNRAFLQALGLVSGATPASEVERIRTERVAEQSVGGFQVRTAFKSPARKAPEAYAFEISGPGFWGPIFGWLAVDAKLENIVGITFTRHSETPGLGGRIDEPWFRKQFVGKRTAALRLVPEGAEKGPNDVDAITGATRTSQSVEKLLNADLKRFLEAMRKLTGEDPHVRGETQKPGRPAKRHLER